MKKIAVDYEYKAIEYPAGDVRPGNFGELYDAAFGENGRDTDLTISELADWCEWYGNCWNGERWDASLGNGVSLPDGVTHIYPVYEQWLDDDGEIEFGDIVGYNVSRY